MLNNWNGQGRLVKDVELRYTASQIPVASFTIACERDYKPKDGERETDFLDVVAWKSNAEFVEKWFHKGDMIIISGRLQTRTYEDKNGNKRKVVEILGNTFNFGGGKSQGTGGQPSGGQNAQMGGYQQNYQPAGNYQQSGYQPAGNYQQQSGYQQQSYQPHGKYDAAGKYDGFMNIPDGIDEELPF